jgi:hypothetical protein
VGYAIRIPANKHLELAIEDLLFRSPCRPSRKPSLPGERSPAAVERLAYNLGSLWRRLVLPARIDTWSLTSLQQRLVKTGGRLVSHARYYWLLLAESRLTRRLFGAMLKRTWTLPVPTGWRAAAVTVYG